jgi:two-component system cell cycle response regulator
MAVVSLMRLIGLLRRSDDRNAELQADLDDIARQRDEAERARVEAEQRLSSRIELTAMRQGTQGDVLTDADTGLHNEGYFTVVLAARIAASRRSLTPLAVVILEAVQGLDGGSVRLVEPRSVASALSAAVGDSGTVFRLLDGSFAAMLDDTDDSGAIFVVQQARSALVAEAPAATVWAGVACYPAHGLTSDEVLDRADLALDRAREWRQDRIEVATAADA